MSVPKNERGESGMQFLMTARDIEISCIKLAQKMPKRMTFFLSQYVTESAVKIYANCKRANSVYPVNAHEVQMRKDYLIKAHCECQNLISQIDIAGELCPEVSSKQIKLIMDMLINEMKCIKGLISTDKERYKNIK